MAGIGVIYVPHGFFYVVRCLFKGTSSLIISGDVPVIVWDCMFFDAIPSTYVSEGFENYANYVAVLTLIVTQTARGCMIPYQVTDGPKEPTLGSGSLGNLVCRADSA
jgi:hypothetical protein